MQQIQFSTFGGPDVLQLAEVDAPAPGPGEILITVTAAAVNPLDWKIRRGLMAEQFPTTFPAGMGSDASGHVIAIGDGVSGVAVGDPVYGLGRNTYAEQAILFAWAPVPDSVDVGEAAGWGAVTETAARVLDELGLADGETVLISGASGGVGTATVQLAAARGLSVIGTASAANQDYLTSLGATPLPYGDRLVQRVAAVAPNGVDGAVDVSGSGVLDDLVEITGTADRVISIADPQAAVVRGVRTTTVGANAPAAFAEAASVPRFRIPVQSRYRLADAGAAQEENAAGHTRGKIILLP